MTWRNRIEWPDTYFRAWSTYGYSGRPRPNPAIKWATEADLCAAFIASLPEGWKVYPESCGFDMVLVEDATGVQIGVEAKLTLNVKVLQQVLQGESRVLPGPDYRAVLVGKTVGDMPWIARMLDVVVIVPTLGAHHPKHLKRKRGVRGPILPFLDIGDLPGEGSDWGRDVPWGYRAPISRLVLPEYVPNVPAGVPAPMTLSPWKIQAIKMCVHVETVGAVCRADFKALRLDPGRWMTGHWLEKAMTRGYWVAGKSFAGKAFKREHPTSYAEIKADAATWPERPLLDKVERVEACAPIPDQGALL